MLDEARKQTCAIVEARRTLDVHLEHMVLFLEQRDAAQLRTKKEIREEVLSMVRATIAWKADPRTGEELQGKIKTLSESMKAFVKRLLSLLHDPV